MAEKLDEEKLDEAMEIAKGFSRCQGYPQTGRAFTQLAKGLLHASEVTGISMEAIAQRCAEETEYCPTDALLLSIARRLKPYIPPKSEPYPKPARCTVCNGTGWQIVDGPNGTTAAKRCPCGRVPPADRSIPR